MKSGRRRGSMVGEGGLTEAALRSVRPHEDDKV